MLDKIGITTADRARTEALDKVGPVILSALDEYHGHLVVADKKMAALEEKMNANLDAFSLKLGQQESSYKTMVKYLMKFLDKAHAEPETLTKVGK